jgi:DNA-binding NtrC family response regulator
MNDTSRSCCLIAEDQALIAMALEATLEDAGIRVAGPFASSRNALAWMARQTPVLAIIDCKLQDGPCTALVNALLARDVPIIVTSGLPQGPETPRERDGLTWLEKPIDRADLLAAMERLAPSLFDSSLGTESAGRMQDPDGRNVRCDAREVETL